ncbi:Uncharacterized protein cmbei_500210 [Cryptosporidium meleagridis]
MVEKIFCRIISQIPLIKYSKLGIIVRIHASKFVSEDEQVDLVFDIYIDELVPSKSNVFFDISVNNSKGDLILLTSESRCVVAHIPWEKNIGEFKRINNIFNSGSSSSISDSNPNSNPSPKSTINLNSSLPNASAKKQHPIKFKRPSHSYGLFEEDYEINNFHHSNQDSEYNREFHSDNYSTNRPMSISSQNSKSQVANQSSSKRENNNLYVYYIPLVTGITVFNALNLKTKDHHDQVFHSGNNNQSNIIKSLWYHLDDYIVFLLIKSSNNNNKSTSKLIVLDLISVINSKNEANPQSLYNIENNFIVNYFSTNNYHDDNHEAPVDFVFGKGPDIWNILTIYILFEDNTIFSICPVIMNRMKLPYFAYQLLYTHLLEQEFLLNSKDELIDKTDFCYDENLHNTLNILLGDLRNPMDESGKIIEEVLQVSISKENFQIISSALKPIPMKLFISWKLENHELKDVKSLKFISITNHPLSVFVILGSNLEIGVFIASYLSLPKFQDNNESNSNQRKTSAFVLNKQMDSFQLEDIQDEFNFTLECIQKSKIPLDFETSSKEPSNEENKQELLEKIISKLRFYDGIHFYNTSGTDIVNININKPLFIVGISTESNLFVIYIDWLHYLFTLYSTIESEINYQDEDNKVLPVSENLEIIRKCIDSNPELKIHQLISFNDFKDYCNTNFNNTCLTFTSNYCIGTTNGKNNIDRNKVEIEFIYNLNSNSNNSQNENGDSKSYILCNPDYDELPEISNDEIQNTKSIKREFNIKDFIDLDNIDNESNIDRNNNDSETTQVDYQLSKLNEYTQESLLTEMNKYYSKFNLLRNEIKSIKSEKEISEYYLNVLKFLNEYNSNIILRLNNSTKPVINLIENIKPRINLISELKEEIEKSNEEIKKREDEIQLKIKNTLEISDSINERILRVKNLFIQELNNHRIQYNQDIIIPELLLMLSNVQLELCSAIFNSFNSNLDRISTKNGNDDGPFGINNEKCKSYDELDQQKISSLNNEFNNYLKYNKFVINKFQNLQNRILELNRIVCNYSK